MDIQTIADLAKQGGRLSSNKQWVLADALAQLTKTQIQQVANVSGRNESTLLQYDRAAERWPTAERVEGVSFSAHRVVLSWHDPRGLLLTLKEQHGSPTVKQVREAMGLEGHPAIEALGKGIKKLDRKVSQKALSDVIDTLNDYLGELVIIDTEYDPDDDDEFTPTEQEQTHNKGLVGKDLQEIPEWKNENGETVPVTPEAIEDMERKGTWTPPIRTSDVAGI